MDLKQHLLNRKRFFDEKVQQYKGSDPLKLRCEFLNWLENYSKEDVADIYLPLLEETLNLFIEDPVYKQDTRFVKMWLTYSSAQPNPLEVIKNMHSRGLGTECAVLYSTWAEQLIKSGSLLNADAVFKMGLNGNIQPKGELQEQYDKFLIDIGRRTLMEKIQCPKCGSSFQIGVPSGSSENPLTSGETVEILDWKWNPLKVGEVDDFHCPIAYFEDPDSTKIRMYPKDKVYPGNGQEFSLEELLAEEYEKKYREEEERKALIKAKEEEDARRLKEEETRKLKEEEDARKQQEELRKREAEKLTCVKSINPPVQASIPVIPKLLSLPKDIDNSLANSTTFTVHTKEAMNVIQDMWSSPVPSQVASRLFHNDKPAESNQPPITTPKLAPFEVYTEDPAPNNRQSQKTPFQIYDENINAVQRKSTRSSQKPRLLGSDGNENLPPGQEIMLTSKQASALKPKATIEIYNDTQDFIAPDENFKHPESLPKRQLFKDEGGAELAQKLESQARIQPPMFDVQDKNDDFSDITCNTKAFEFILPSSTPLATNKVLKPLSCAQHPDGIHKTEPTNLSVILEQSKDKSGNSSASSLASHSTKSSRSGPLFQSVPETFDPFNSEVIESLLEKIGFPKSQHLPNYYTKKTNLPTGIKSMKLGDETFSIQGEIGRGAYAKVLKAANSSGKIVALKIEKPACKWEYYIAKEIQSRVHPKYAAAFMDISAAYIYNNGSILETPYAKYGTLTSCINITKEKTGKSLDLGLILHFSLELIEIVEHLHKCKIIHADLKPDNVVLRELPSYNEELPCLQLIDFGRCLDMSLFPPDTKFHTIFKTEDNKCIEMKENRPWNYQIDLQGLASLFHVLLFSDYMKVHKKNNKWQLQQLIPRNVHREVWNPIFDSLLNVNPATDLPFNFNPMKESLLEVFRGSLSNNLLLIKIFGNNIAGK